MIPIRSFCQALCLSCVALSVSSTSAELASVVGEFDEHYSTEVPVSGNVIAGLMLAPASKIISQEFSPYIQLPESTDMPQTVCLSVVSQDGVYSANNTYRIPPSAVGNLIRADYTQSKHQQILIEKDASIALKAQPGSCGNVSSDQYLITQNGPDNSDAQLILKIDSLGATDVLVASRGADRKVTRGQCQQLAGDRKTGFDYSCTLPVQLPAQGATQVRIQRLRFGRKMPAITLMING